MAETAVSYTHLSGKTVWGSDCHGRGSHGNLIENMEGSVAMELYLNEERVDVVKKYLDLYPIAVSYTHLDVYKRQAMIIIPPWSSK